MNAKANLDFIEKNFNDIFKGYLLKKYKDEDGTKEDREQEITKEKLIVKDTIVIISENFEEILRSLNAPFFMFKTMKGNMKDFDEIIISNSCIDDVVPYYMEKVLRLNYTMGYRTGFYKFLIVKEARTSYFQRAVKAILIKKLSPLEEQILDGFDMDIQVLRTEELKDFMLDIRCNYVEKRYFNTVLADKFEITNANSGFAGSVSVVISSKICTEILELLKIDDYAGIENRIKDICLKEFEEQSINIMSVYIKAGEFTFNYELIDKFMEHRKKLEEIIVHIYREKLEIGLRYIKFMTCMSTEMFLMLQEGSINDIDSIIEDRLSAFIEDIESLKIFWGNYYEKYKGQSS